MTGPASETGALRPTDPLADIIRDERPWGAFERYTLNQPSTVKIITVKPGEQLSLQRHTGRDELWVVLDPGVIVEVDGERATPAVGEKVLVRAGQTHRLAATNDGPARVLEVAFGRFDEDDIERLEDAYGRS